MNGGGGSGSNTISNINEDYDDEDEYSSDDDDVSIFINPTQSDTIPEIETALDNLKNTNNQNEIDELTRKLIVLKCKEREELLKNLDVESDQDDEVKSTSTKQTSKPKTGHKTSTSKTGSTSTNKTGSTSTNKTGHKPSTNKPGSTSTPKTGHKTPTSKTGSTPKTKTESKLSKLEPKTESESETEFKPSTTITIRKLTPEDTKRMKNILDDERFKTMSMNEYPKEFIDEVKNWRNKSKNNYNISTYYITEMLDKSGKSTQVEKDRIFKSIKFETLPKSLSLYKERAELKKIKDYEPMIKKGIYVVPGYIFYKNYVHEIKSENLTTHFGTRQQKIISKYINWSILKNYLKSF